MIQDLGNALRRVRALIWLLALCASVGWAPHAVAQNCSASSATITLPAVTVQPNASVGTLLGSPQQVTMNFTCSNIPVVVQTSGRTSKTYNTTTTIQAGETLATLASTNVTGGPGITFATNLPGIGVIVNGTPTITSSNSGSVNDGPNSEAGFPVGSVTAPTGAGNGTTYGGTVTETFSAQLIVTGTITASSIGTISANSLIPFWWYIPGGTVDPDSISLGASLNISGGSVVMQACTVSSGANMTVTLPTINARSLTSIGSTAGLTGFTISLACQSGATATITMATANPATATGVIAPTSGTGYASNVGIQILNSSSAPITFNTPQSLGSTPSGTLNIPYFAQYYVTATPVSAGQVTGTVTFTMSYQ
jgi:type 1 fimbria pilin